MSVIYLRPIGLNLFFWPISLLVIGVALFLLRPSELAVAPSLPQQRMPAATLASPLRFEQNRGQTDAQVQYLARAKGYTLFLTATEAVVQQSEATAPLRIQWAGGRPEVQPQGSEALPGVSHYFTGAAGAGPRGVPAYAQVHYPQVYPGIDLVFYSTPEHLEYDFVLAPGADPAHIELLFQGADRVEIDAQGDLLVTPAAVERPLRFKAPVIYQPTAGGRVTVAGAYRLDGEGRVGFVIADYDQSQTLVIDPVLTLGSYLGGSGAEQGSAVASDSVGNLYLTGETASVDFPGASPGNAGGSDVYVVKLNASGTLAYAAYLGGSGKDRGFGIAVDGAGSAHVTGDTESVDFPVQLPIQNFAGGSDAFVTKLSANGASLVYSTYLGGSAGETARALTLDGSGRAYVTGGTTSDNFPVSLNAPHSGIVQVTNPSTGAWYADAFIVRLNAAGSAREYSTYLGGDNIDTAIDIALTSSGEAVVAGATASSDLPVVNATQTLFRGVPEDGFIAQLNAAGDAFSYVSYLGGNAWDRANAVAVDAFDDIYVVGSTNSDNFPISNAVQDAYGGGRFDAFLAKIDATSRLIEYATYLGGEGVDEAQGVALDSSNNPWLVGATESVNFPRNSALQHQLLGSRDAFVAQYTSAGSVLAFSSYFGGTADDAAASVINDQSSGANLVMTGTTTSDDFPLFGAAQSVAGGSGDGYVARFSPVTSSADLALAMTVAESVGRTGVPLDFELTVTNLGPDIAGLVTVLNTLPDALRFDSASSAQGSCVHNSGTVRCSVDLLAINESATFTLTVVPRSRGTHANTASIVRAQQTDSDVSNNDASVDVDIASGDSGRGSIHWGWLLLTAGALLLRRRH